MAKIRRQFSHDELIKVVRAEISKGLKSYNVCEKQRGTFSNLDCLMSVLAIFTFKYASLLQFNKAVNNDNLLQENLERLFKLSKVPCDTYTRERVDEINPQVLRHAYKGIFRLLQRGKVLEQYKFYDGHYLLSVDGTGMFSSPTVHCENCCVKEHRNGSKTYYHQVLAASIVHPEKKAVLPLFPEPIMKSDGQKKNDCERNATKRLLGNIRREHPFLKLIFMGDGLSSNAPLIREIQKHEMKFLLIAKDDDHKYLKDWINAGDAEDAPKKEVYLGKGKKAVYQYMKDVPLNESNFDLKVNVIIYRETGVDGKEKKWMWVTDLDVNMNNIAKLVKGGRARWKIENETFNTLKNQGYNFEHNYGHGYKYLNQVFAAMMILAFFIDQCLQDLNHLFQAAYAKLGSKKALWQMMLSALYLLEISSFESLYRAILDPPRIKAEFVQ